MDPKQNWISELVTKKATVMTSLLILNGLVLFFGTLVYLKSGGQFILFVWVLILVYTIYRHERWANKAPWLLAPQKVAMHGMNLFGTSDKKLNVSQIIDLDQTDNPELKQLDTSTIKKDKVTQ